MDNIECGRQRLKDIVEIEAREKEEQIEDNSNLRPQEHERALKGAYRSFVIPGILKADIDSYADWAKSQIKELIEAELKDVIGKMKETCEISFHFRPWIGKESAQDITGKTGGNYIRVEMPFNSLMTKFFEASDIEELMQDILHISRPKL